MKYKPYNTLVIGTIIIVLIMILGACSPNKPLVSLYPTVNMAPEDVPRIRVYTMDYPNYYMRYLFN